MNLLEISERRRQTALRVIRESGVVEAWESVGATVNLVGSVRSGLIMKNLDIDLHIYTDEPMLEKSFAAIGRLEQNPAVKDILFYNLLDTDDECLEWHAWYEDSEDVGDAGSTGVSVPIGAQSSTGSKKTGTIWKLDMIHIRRGSAFDGVIERTTDAIIARLDPKNHAIPETAEVSEAIEALGTLEARESILRIKHDAPDGVKPIGIEVYYAVLELGLHTYDEFAAWKQANPDIDLLGWMP